MESFSSLFEQISQAMAADRHALRRQLRRIQDASKAGKPCDRNLARFQTQLQQSHEARRQRLAGVPAVRFDPQLPITARLPEIRAAIEQHPVTIVCGETGSGKSTQLPKLCLQAGRGVDGLIGHTQPRRIAARSVAARIAEELGSPLGSVVGYKIRFTDATQPSTYIKLMTDGVLLAETQHDRFLDHYDTIILDEAHERSLNIDFLLGYLKRLLPRRPDLKVIITSATIDAERFSQHFPAPDTGRPAPIIEVSGRAYPIEIRYRPLVADPSQEQPEDPDVEDVIRRTAAELAASGPGDMLVFLPTERDILEAAKSLRGMSLPGEGPPEVLPLYARLSAAEQAKVFQPHGRRRIVLATNVAESSLTVPGIRFVIDTGTARISRYSPRRKVQRLPIEAVSQASADQRAGRCGRVGPGICVRLYSEEDYLGRDRYTPPEIRRTNLASVILQTRALQLGPIEEFPFLDPPRLDAIQDGYKTLFEIGALDAQRQLTDLGRQVARLPVDPRIARMVLAGAAEGCLPQVLIIASALEVQEPRERPHDKQQAADAAHARFGDESSDFLSYLKLWDFYHQLREKLTRNQLRKACRQNFLSANRLREWLDIHRQLKRLVAESGVGTARRGGGPADAAGQYAAIHRALLTGLLSNVAQRGDGYEYHGAGGMVLHLWPGSGVFDKKPAWIVAAELVETTRNYARTVARIEPGWIEPLALHLVKRSYSNPHWSRRAGSAMAYEKVTLWGLPIVARRRVRYGPIDPRASRDLLIQQGLIAGLCQLRAGFLARNLRLVEELDALATRSRRTDLFVSHERQYEFYDQRIPAELTDVAQLDRWWRDARRASPGVLVMAREDLLGDAEIAAPEAYPSQLAVGPTPWPLEYRFEPGADGDGVTITVPKAALNQLDAGRLGWLVPGLLEDKIVALIRSLPKPIRRNFVPAPDVARRAVQRLRFGEGSFLHAVANALRQVSGEGVAVEAFQLDKLPPHLHMNIRVVDDDGHVLSFSRDLRDLQEHLHQKVSQAFDELRHEEWGRDGIVRWDLEEFPEQVTIISGGMTLLGYPMLVDQGREVSLRLADSAERALRETRHGLRRLYCLAEKNELRGQVAWLPGLDQWKLCAATLCGARQLEQMLEELIADRAFLEDGGIPRSTAEFEQRRKTGRQRIGLAVQDVMRVVRPLLEAYHQVALALEDADPDRWPESVEDVRSQLAALTAGPFLVRTPWHWLEQFPRYFQAIRVRLYKLVHTGAIRDRQLLTQIGPFWESYRQRQADHDRRGLCDPELEHFRWLLEEFRVSLFAQELGTRHSVSARRLERQWEKVQV